MAAIWSTAFSKRESRYDGDCSFLGSFNRLHVRRWWNYHFGATLLGSIPFYYVTEMKCAQRDRCPMKRIVVYLIFTPHIDPHARLYRELHSIFLSFPRTPKSLFSFSPHSPDSVFWQRRCDVAYLHSQCTHQPVCKPNIRPFTDSYCHFSVCFVAISLTPLPRLPP